MLEKQHSATNRVLTVQFQSEASKTWKKYSLNLADEVICLTNHIGEGKAKIMFDLNECTITYLKVMLGDQYGRPKMCSLESKKIEILVEHPMLLGGIIKMANTDKNHVFISEHLQLF